MTTRPQPGDRVRFLRGDLKGQIGVWTLEKPGVSVTMPSGMRVFNPGPIEIVTRDRKQEMPTVNTRTLATLARVAAHPAVQQRHLGEYFHVDAQTYAIHPGDVKFHLGGVVSLPLLNSLIAWGYLLDRPQVTLFATDTGVHVFVAGYLDSDHVAAWTGFTADAAEMLRAAMGGERKAVVPLYVLRSTAVQLCAGEAGSR